jgi:hypothetical protein
LGRVRHRFPHWTADDGSATEDAVMASLATARRVLMGHDWQDLAEWVRAIDQLADMSDDEIEGLASLTPEALPNAA